MKQFVFLTDIDGTLLRRDAPLSAEVIDAAHAYTGQGGLLSLCTGRSLPAVQEIAGCLGVNAPSVLYGGAMLYDFQEERCLACFPFSWDVMQAVEKILRHEPAVSIQVFTPEHVCLLRSNQRLETYGVAEELSGDMVLHQMVSGPVLKIGMCCDDPQRLQACRAYFPEHFCQFSFSSRTFADVVAAGCGKRQAMQYLSDYLKIPCRDFFCAGDAAADLPMLQLAGTSFAPQNAIDEVKAAVSFVVPSVAEGGMREAFLYAAKRLEEASAALF